MPLGSDGVKLEIYFTLNRLMYLMAINQGGVLNGNQGVPEIGCGLRQLSRQGSSFLLHCDIRCIE